MSYSFRLRLERATTLRAPLIFALAGYVNGVVSIGLSFIDIEELMFVNVYIYDTSQHFMLGETGTIPERYIHGD